MHAWTVLLQDEIVQGNYFFLFSQVVNWFEWRTVMIHTSKRADDGIRAAAAEELEMQEAM